MRHLLIFAALLGTAACAAPPGGPIEGPVLPVFPVISLDLPMPNLVPSFLAEPGPGRLTLNNFSFDSARIDAIVTTSPDCSTRVPGEVESNFVLPLNGTRIIATPPGADVCWRRELEPGAKPAAAIADWSEWNRAYVAQGTSVNTRL